MPSKHPRLALTVPPSLRAAIDDLAQAQGLPASKVIITLLEQMEPQIRNLAKLHNLAKVGDEAEMRRVLNHMVGDNLAAILMPDDKGNAA